MNPKNISVVIIRKETNVWVCSNVQCRREIFTLSLVSFMTVEFKKLVSNLFHAGKERMYQEKKEGVTVDSKHNNSLETFYMQYRSTLKCISLTSHCKYRA